MAPWAVPRLSQPPGPAGATGPGPGAALVAGRRLLDRRVIWADGVALRGGNRDRRPSRILVPRWLRTFGSFRAGRAVATMMV